MITPNIIERSWIQGATVAVEYLTGTAFSGENGAHTFRITGKDTEGQPVAVSGTVLAKILRADNITVDVSGSVVDGVAEVTLVGDCYNVPGRTSLVIFLSDGTNTVTLYAAIFNVFRSTSGEEIDSGVSIPTLTELLAQIERMEAATAAAEAAAEEAEAAATVVTRIPSAYRQVEYLDNAGTAYIDIQEPLTGDSRVFCVFALNNVPTDSIKPVFGWYRNSYDSYAIVAQNGNWMYRYGSQGSLVTLKTGADKNIHVLDFNKGKISLDGTVYADNDVLEFTASNQFRVFGSQSGVAAQRIVGDVRIYRFDWYKADELIHSYIPAKRVADGVFGLWDLVEEEFVVATSGDFTAGAEVNLVNNTLALDEIKSKLENGGGSSGVTDVQVNGTSVVNDGIVNFASSFALSGTKVGINFANQLAIDGRWSGYSLNMPQLPYAVKSAMSAPVSATDPAWTDAEKAAALVRIGAERKLTDGWALKGTMTTTDPITVDLTGCTEFYVKGYCTATGNSNLNVVMSGTTKALLSLIAVSGDRHTFAMFATVGSDDVMSLYAKYGTQSTNINTAYNAYHLTGGGADTITKFQFQAPAVITACNIAIYAR